VAWLLVGLAALAMFAGGAFAAAYVASPTALVRDQLVRQVKQQTGRELSIGGRTTLSFWGGLVVGFGDVALSAPPAMGGAPLMRAKQIKADVALWPLVRGEVIVDRLVLAEPLFDLRVDANGRRSWDFAEASAARLQYAQAAKPGAERQVPPELADFLAHSSKDTKDAAALRARTRATDLAIGAVSVRNGTVRYQDARSASDETIVAVDLDLTGTSLAQVLLAKGGGKWRGDEVAVDARLASPAALFEGRSTRLAAVLKSVRGEARYEGSITLAGSGPQADGALSITAPSARSLADWVGGGLPPMGRLGPVSLNGEVKFAANTVQFSRAVLQLDGAKVEGDIALDVGGQRPQWRGDLSMTGFDADAILRDRATAAAPSRARAAAAAPAVAGPAAGGSRGLTIEDLLRRDSGEAPTTAGRNADARSSRAGWSIEPLSGSPLGDADAEARLSLNSVRIQGMTIDGTVVRLVLRNRVLSVNFEDLRLYGGRGRGVVTIDASQPNLPQVGLNVSVDGVAGLPLLTDAGGFDWLDGKAHLQLALGGQGGNEKAIVESLNGRMDVAFTDGAVLGVDVGKTIRGLTEGRFNGIERRQGEKTPFDELAASFRITNGVAETRDLRLNGPDVRMNGAGTSDLGKRQLDFSLKPRLAPVAGKPDSGIEIPLRLTGSWDAPRLSPDIDAVLKDPNKAVDAVREFVRRPGVSDGVKGVLDAWQEGDKATARERAKGLLDQFMKR
jgi:AsmA protein